jgi:hypothetical protein
MVSEDVLGSGITTDKPQQTAEKVTKSASAKQGADEEGSLKEAKYEKCTYNSISVPVQKRFWDARLPARPADGQNLEK